VVDVRPPVKIFGDIHGQLQDLLRLFSGHGFPIGCGGDIDVVTYVFNGDFVDRGSHQLEVLLLLFSLKIAHPTRVVLLRGNHETNSVSSFYGFKKECFRVSCSLGRNPLKTKPTTCANFSQPPRSHLPHLPSIARPVRVDASGCCRVWSGACSPWRHRRRLVVAAGVAREQTAYN
jgi:hypothetical protein